MLFILSKLTVLESFASLPYACAAVDKLRYLSLTFVCYVLFFFVQHQVFEYGTVIRDVVDIHCPVNEMVCNSKIR